MCRCLGILAVLLLGLATAVSGRTQVSMPAPALERAAGAGTSLGRVIGEVTATDLTAKQVSVKTDAGGTVTVIFQENTLYLRVRSEERRVGKECRL